MQTTRMQTLIFDRARFTPASAQAWARRHGKRADKVDITDRSIRIRQRPPGAFKQHSFRTITLTDGVKAVIARPRSNPVVPAWLWVTLGAGAAVAGMYWFGRQWSRSIQ